MSNFEHRIKEDSTEFEKAFLKIYDGSLWTALEKMKDWQPPKPLVEVPESFDKWYKEIIEKFGVYGKKFAIKNISQYGFGSLLEDAFYRTVRDEDLLTFANDYESFLSAIIDGYTVKKEQLYEIRLPIPDSDIENDYALVDISGNIWEDAFPTKYKLTKQEIKAIDERYLAFAVKVDEVEP